MSTPARSPRANSSASKLELVPDHEKARFFDQFYGLVSDRAYSLFEDSGGFHGDDVSHWLQAERELAALPDNFVEEQRSLYYVVRWPEPIDPESCNAKFDSGNLTLSTRKARRKAGGTSDDSPASDTSSATSRGGAS